MSAAPMGVVDDDAPPRPINLQRTANLRTMVHFDKGAPRIIKDADTALWKERIRQAALGGQQDEPSLVSTSSFTPSESTMSGSLQAPATSSSATLRLKGEVDIDYNPHTLGWILRGLVEQARGCGNVDPFDMFLPKGENKPTLTKNERLLKELGRELFDALPAALAFFNVSPEEYQAWYRSAHRPSCATPSGSSPRGPVKALPAEVVTSSAAWLAPVVGRITSRFGVQRGGERHEGIDVAAAVGTSVVAPQVMQVTKVGYSERAGRYVVANVMREGGSFDDGDGYRLTFAHLSEVHVQEDAIVQRGQTLGLSGATGNVTGPHLHFRVQWVEDGILSDDVVAIDPLAVIPEQVFEGRARPSVLNTRQSVGLRHGQPINIVIAPGAGRVSAGGRGVTQPDLGLQLSLPQQGNTESSSYRAPAPRLSDHGDPLAGIVNEVVEEAPGLIRNVGHLAQGLGTLASVGGTLASFIPGAAPVAGPIAAAGGAVSAAAVPVSELSAGALEVGSQLASNLNTEEDPDPMAGVLY